jgi:methionyl-tRNA synthetase
MKKHTITAALPYANGPLHLGHLAGAYLPADIYARFLRLQGKDVAFVCGSDEHGAAITIRAKKEGRSPQEIIDTYHFLNKETFEKLGISFDIYHRTSDKLHHETAQEFFRFLNKKGGEFEEKETEQYYDEAYKQFLADRYITGTCPKCGHEEAFGDQCEKCGSALSPTELINPRSTMSGNTPVLKPTTHWYFKLDKHGDELREWIETGKINGVQHHDPESWRKHVLGQCLSWLDSGLQSRAITRDLDWGVPVPAPGAEGKVLYVWFDAPIGYISATKKWALDNGKNWEDYWKGDDVELIHFIGKDNIVFHCIVFPAMLKAHGEFALPVNVPANQFLNLEGRKFSKSKGWVIEQHQYLIDFADFPNKEDALRYALIRTMPENKDGDFKWDEFVALHDNELADNLGNFFNRVLSFIQKYSDGKAPAFDTNLTIKGATEETSSTYSIFCKEQLLPLVEQLEKDILAFEFKNAISTVLEISRLGNAMFQSNAPWKTAKENPEAAEIPAVLALGLQIAAISALCIEPFLPFIAAKMRNLLGLPQAVAGAFERLKTLLNNGEAILPAGSVINEPEVLFAKIQNKKEPRWQELIDLQKTALAELVKKFEEEEKAEAKAEEQKAKATEQTAAKEPIEFDDFAKLELRVGTVESAECIPKKDRLLKLSINLGSETRTIVSGIAEHYAPEDLVGKQVTVVANLKPKKLGGFESHGMILTAETPEGKLFLVQPTEGVANGSVVK